VFYTFGLAGAAISQILTQNRAKYQLAFKVSPVVQIFTGNSLSGQILITASTFQTLVVISLDQTDSTPRLCLKIMNYFRYCQWGHSLPGLCTLDPPLRPPSTLEVFFWRKCLGGGNKLKTFLINFLAILGNFKHFSGFFRRKKTPICFTSNLIFFVT
jgi:hypothetical protein